jgi:hypothetical protein
MKFRGKWALLTLVLCLAVAGGAWAAMERAEMINGTHWTKWSQEDKLVYVRGLTNWADFITEAQAQRGKTSEYCMSKVVVDALKTKTLGQIVADVDAYYRDNPGKMGNSVIEAILRGSTNICKTEPGACKTEPGGKEMKK